MKNLDIAAPAPKVLETLLFGLDACRLLDRRLGAQRLHNFLFRLGFLFLTLSGQKIREPGVKRRLVWSEAEALPVVLFGIPQPAFRLGARRSSYELIGGQQQGPLLLRF